MEDQRGVRGAGDVRSRLFLWGSLILILQPRMGLRLSANCNELLSGLRVWSVNNAKLHLARKSFAGLCKYSETSFCLVRPARYKWTKPAGSRWQRGQHHEQYFSRTRRAAAAMPASAVVKSGSTAQHSKGKLTARERIDLLLDEDSF